MRRTDAPAEALDAIAQGLDRLCKELAVIREVLDEIRDELQWANRNRLADDWRVTTWRPVRNAPSDPFAADKSNTLHRSSAADLPLEADVDAVNSSKQSGRLF